MKTLLFLMLILVVPKTLASSKGNCSISSLSKFYHYLRSEGPIITQTKEQLKIPNTKVDIASQRPNPGLSAGYLYGNEFGIPVNNYSVSLKHTIELGDKRKKRMENARVQASISEKTIELQMKQYFVEQVKKYQRFVQLEVLINTISKAVKTFDKLTNKLKAVAKLTPEEGLSISTLRLASSDYKLRLNAYINERELLRGDLEYATNCSKVNGKYYKLNYHKIEGELGSNELGLSLIEKLKIKYQEKNLELQRSIGYSNLSIGPQIDYQRSGNNKFIAGGIALSFGIPFFHTNNGGKLEASKMLAYQKISSRNNLNFIQLRKQKLIEKYKRTLKLLESQPSIRTLETKRKESELLLDRGIISMSVAIEVQRQNISFLTSRFQTELELMNIIIEMIGFSGSLRTFEKIM